MNPMAGVFEIWRPPGGPLVTAFVKCKICVVLNSVSSAVGLILGILSEHYSLLFFRIEWYISI